MSLYYKISKNGYVQNVTLGLRQRSELHLSAEIH